MGVATFDEELSQIIHLSDGRFISVLRRPMRMASLVSSHEDITERQQLQVRLEQQNEQLDVAMNNMSQGLAMFDDHQQLVVCNKLYAEMYGLSPEQVQPGTTVREILEYRLANGCYTTTEPEQFADDRVAKFGRLRPTCIDLADGRVINVTNRRAANGGQVSPIRTSPSARGSALDSRQQEEKLRLKNVQLDAALNNMVQGLAMFDAELRVVVCQRPLRADVRPRAPEQVAPRHDRCGRSSNARSPTAAAGARRPTSWLDTMPARRDGQAQRHYTSTLSDGRYIAVSLQSDGRRRHRHHPSGHHRAAPLGGQDRAHGAARCADRTCPIACC